MSSVPRPNASSSVVQESQSSSATDTAPRQRATLLTAAIAATGRSASQPVTALIDKFRSAATARDALISLYGGIPELSLDEIGRQINQLIALIDKSVNTQLNLILHHSAFQKLEASWRGLQSMADRIAEEAAPNTRIRILNVTWKELEKDFGRALDFDQSQLFKKVYDNEFGMPGGIPFGALLADYQIRPFPTVAYPHDDFSMLKWLSQVGAAAFCPIILGVSPAMFGEDEFGALERSYDHASTFARTDYLKWRQLRESEDARFLGLVLPRALMREPYQDDGSRIDRFVFHEDVSGPDNSKYLWGSPIYPFGNVLIRSFSQTGWLAGIRGVYQDHDGGGLVTDLPSYSFSTDVMGLMPRISADVAISDELERQLSEQGFISLCPCQGTRYSAFYSCPSIQKPKKYDRNTPTANARISSMLHHIFCASRFAHFLKLIARDKIGSTSEAGQLERFLHDWIVEYVAFDNEASLETKAKYPLREARVTVQPQPGKPGSYNCVMHLVPHFEIDDLAAAITLETELAPPRSP